MIKTGIPPTHLRPRMSLGEFNALPDDPTLDRMLIRGRLWEKPRLFHTRQQGQIEARMAHLLVGWTLGGTRDGSMVLSGECGCDLPDLETGVGIDVAVFSAETLAAQEADSPFMVGPPILAVEILSPNDCQDEIRAKIEVYLEAEVKLVWIVDPSFKTVTVYRPDANPAMFSGDDEINAEPHLPGFTLPVSQLFQL